MLELIFLEGPAAGRVVPLNFDRAWFGRQATCDVVLDEEGTSRLHFSIERQGADYVLVDNRSTNGTFLNGARVERSALKPGDDILAGRNRIQVRQSMGGAERRFRFVAAFVAAENASQVVEEQAMLAGRKSICQLQLNHPSIAAVHAQFECRDDGVWVTDQSNGAGIYVNGKRAVSERLDTADVVQIGPFIIAISVTEEICYLTVWEERVEQTAASPQIPGNYRDVVAPPAGLGTGQAKPSESIAALPHWMQAKAPIWVPSSDILPNRFRSTTLVIFTLGAFGLAALGGVGGALAKKWDSAYSPGGLSKVHASINCKACHVGFGEVSDVGCHGCHQAETASVIHTQHKVACAGCHSEHQGFDFDPARNVGQGCQAAGCHVTVHTREKQLLAQQAPPQPGLKPPAAVAMAARFEAGDALHDKHANLAAGCAACHTGGDPSLAAEDPAYPEIAIKERTQMRMRCLGCHGFGPEATLRARCYSCHVEHPAGAARILTTLRFSGEAPAKSALAEIHPGGLLVFAGALGAVPLFFLAATLGSFRVHQRSARAEVEKQVRSRPGVRAEATMMAPVPAATPASSSAEVKKTDNQAPGGVLRPLIDVDLCVGCGTCVHVCPFNVLEIVNEKAIAARLGDCTGFAACAAECPTEAIALVAGGAMQTAELPVYDQDLETNVPGLYLAGEVTGKALIKVAINQGKKVVESMLKKPIEPGAPYDVIVVGAGPAGTSVALSAKAEGLKVLVLEQGNQGNTIRSYPRQKFVMAEPVMIPLFGPLWMEDTSKESLLERWQEIISKTGLEIQEEEKVLRVARDDGHFAVRTTKGEYRGARVVLAIGKRGSPRKLGVPGEDSSKVAYNLLDADAYRATSICIVGGGDSGIEAACGLSRTDLQNQVWLVHRLEDFSRAKPRNQKKIKKAMDEGRIKAFFTSEVTEIRERSVLVKTSDGVQEVTNDFVFVMVGGESPTKFLTDCGIEFSKRALG